MFAFAYGRIGNFSPRAVSVLLALGGFLAVYVVPNLKYPANPPSVGEPETIGLRTALYFSIMLISIAAMVIAVMAHRRLTSRFGGWSATLIAAAGYLVVVTVVDLLLPAINEVPEVGDYWSIVWCIDRESLPIEVPAFSPKKYAAPRALKS